MSDGVDGSVSAEGSLGRPSGEGHVHVLGTAHVSQQSVDEVEATIAERKPDVVAVELDEGRYRQLKGDEPEDLDAGDLLRGNTVFQFLAYWLLSYVQSRLGDRFDISPGADMMAAVETAEENGFGVALVDRDIQTTVQRFWARLSGLEKLRLIFGLMLGATDSLTLGYGAGFFIALMVGIPLEAFIGPVLLGGVAFPALAGLGGLVLAVLDLVLVTTLIGAALGTLLVFLFSVTGGDAEEVEEFDIEELTDADVVTAMMEEFRQFSPGGAEALIDERDAYIAHRLVALREAGYDVVAVVGAGHRAGIEQYLDNPETLPPMDSLVGQERGGRFSVYKLLGYVFTLGFLVFFVLLALASVSDGFLLRLLAAWFIVNAVFAFALAKLAGAHWTSASVGGAVAWLTSVNPLLAPGWFAGYVELRYLDVNISDISTLNEILDDESAPVRDIFARMRDVPLFRLILVVALTNVGSFIASMLFLWAVVPYFAAEIGGVGEITRLMLEGARNGADIVWGLVA
jgi:pheromone shutdown protein TraB